MASFRTGTVVLIKFPFTDGSGAKKRPALVLLDTDGHDLLLAKMDLTGRSGLAGRIPRCRFRRDKNAAIVDHLAIRRMELTS